MVRPASMTYRFRVEGNSFEGAEVNVWEPIYLTGVDLNAALPGDFPADSVTDPDTYLKWLRMIGNLGVNTAHAANILPPAFYHALSVYDGEGTHAPLWLLQGVASPAPPVTATYPINRQMAFL
jgi:hypothetical protein